MNVLKELRSFCVRNSPFPQEAQKIDKLLEQFSKEFATNNKIDDEKFVRGAESVYAFCFSLIMLNTDMHNSSVKQKMTCENFTKSNRGIVELPEKEMQEIYDSLKETELVLNDSAIV